MKVTKVPAQTGLVRVSIETSAGSNGLTVTAWSANVVPHNPADVAVIVAIPKKAASQFITPVAGSMTPAATGKTEYTIEVLFAAVAV